MADKDGRIGTEKGKKRAPNRDPIRKRDEPGERRDKKSGGPKR